MTSISLKEKVRKERWYYLFKVENGQPVHVYEPLTAIEVNAKQKMGWKVRRI